MVVEGLPYFIAPARTRSYLRQMADLGSPALRILGLLMMVGGLVVAWLALG